jgi:WD40 repeat protein
MTIKANLIGVATISFSIDINRFITGGYDGSIKIWENV